MTRGLPDDLLEPSLARAEPRGAPLSPRATFLISFFGGGVSAALVGAWNARRLRRPTTDLAIAAAMLALSLGIFLYLVTLQRHGELPAWMSTLGKRGPRTLSQALGIAVWGLFSALQRAERRAAELSGLEATNPWPVSLGIIGLGIGIHSLAAYLGLILA